MFKSYELEKLLYVHPTFLGLWYRDSYALARHLLQAQLVGHVLKDVGLVVVVVTVKDINPGNFDPTDGGVFARVRFVCYAFSPVSSSILKGRVEAVQPSGVTVSCVGLPIVTIPRALISRDAKETVYNTENNTFVWTKMIQGAPKLFPIRQNDEIKFRTNETTYGSDRQIVLLDTKTSSATNVAHGTNMATSATHGTHGTQMAMCVTADVKSWGLGPVHWFAGGKPSPKDDSLQAAAETLNEQEDDFLTFMQKLRQQSGC